MHKLSMAASKSTGQERTGRPGAAARPACPTRLAAGPPGYSAPGTCPTTERQPTIHPTWRHPGRIARCAKNHSVSYVSHASASRAVDGPRTSGTARGSCRWRPTPVEACPSAPCCAAACQTSEQVSHRQPANSCDEAQPDAWGPACAHGAQHGEPGGPQRRQRARDAVPLYGPAPAHARAQVTARGSALPSTPLPARSGSSKRARGAQGLELVERGQQRRQRALQRGWAPHAQHLPARV